MSFDSVFVDGSTAQAPTWASVCGSFWFFGDVMVD
jgi:hypothetical protein